MITKAVVQISVMCVQNKLVHSCYIGFSLQLDLKLAQLHVGKELITTKLGLGGWVGGVACLFKQMA